MKGCKQRRNKEILSKVSEPKKDTERAHRTCVGERTVRRTTDAQLAYESVQEYGDLMN